ncbi:Hcp family type VI secretion system effector [Roseibacillus persicicus]|uniref:Hcp family type VI secretion system effector n=1 Tax=Roseibacillus persicicus TaxID=454148 RepID=UPI002811E892|nr:type VI secretion system tube protein Hcp [Roseibacillus persicicus]
MKIGKMSKSLALAAPLVAVAPTDVDAAAYIKIGDIKGEVTAPGFEEYVKLDYFKIEIDGVTNNNKFGIPTISFPMDKGSPKLMLACATGETLEEATVVFTKQTANGTEEAYYKITFSNVRVLSYKNERKEESNIPFDSLTLGYTEVEWTYYVFSSSGSLADTISSGSFTR